MPKDSSGPRHFERDPLRDSLNFGQELSLAWVVSGRDVASWLNVFAKSNDLFDPKDVFVARQWFDLEEAPTGKLHLKLEWLSLLSTSEKLEQVRDRLGLFISQPLIWPCL